MKRLFKCDYCEARPTTTHEKELLCNRHYVVLYGIPITTEQVVDVPKTKKEKELSEHYMEILANHNFVDERKTKRILKEFLRDVRYVRNTNSLYH